MDNDIGAPLVNSWYFDITKLKRNQVNDLNSNRVKGFIYESLYRSITRHNLKECYLLLRLLPKEPFLDPYILLRFVFILLECNPTNRVHKNVIIHLESLLSNFELSKPDSFLEFLGYFIRHERLDDARELFSRRHRYINYKKHRSLPTVRTNISCYEFLLNYLEWSDKSSCQDTKLAFDMSTQGWIVNVMEHLKTVQSNYEYFVICVLKVLLHYGFSKKAYLLVSEFQRQNPNNIGAQLLLNNLLTKLEADHSLIEGSTKNSVSLDSELNSEEKVQNRVQELEKLNNFSLLLEEENFNPKFFPVKEDRLSILKNLRRLDSSRVEIEELKGLNGEIVETLRDLMDGMEMVEQVKNTSRWANILKILDDIFRENDVNLIREVRVLWQTRYRIFWNRVSFLTLAGDDITDSEKDLILKVLTTIRIKLNYHLVDQIHPFNC